MPISASAKKSLRVGLRRTDENRVWKLRVKNQLKKTTAETLNATLSILDKAAKHDILHPNKASRLKSRLMKQFGGSPATATASETAVTKKAPVKKAAAKKAPKE